MDKNWTKWFLASIYKHYTDTLTDAFVEGLPKPNNVPIDRFEIKTIGPDYTNFGTETLVRIEINILVLTGTQVSDPLRHASRIGLAQQVFANCINIYKLGKTDEDDKSLFTYVSRVNDVKTTHFSYDPVVKLMRSTTETTYTVTL